MPADPYTPHRPVPAKPIVKSFPTPDLADRVYVVRKDTRAAGYKLPAKGDPYEGPNANEFEDFMFSTSQPSDQTGWVDHFYLNERLNQDAYNFTIEYPYADVNYPQLTRTYVLLRADFTEPTADDLDPVYHGDVDDDDVAEDTPLTLYLIEHKQIRLEDPVLDALFVGTSRVYQRLPSPVITSYQQNEARQIVTVAEQEVITEVFPVSSALTEILKIERATTAKAKVTTGTVDSVFPGDMHEIEIPDVIPLEFHALIPTVTEAETIASTDAVLPTLATGDLKKSEQALTEFTKRTSVTKRAAITYPVSFYDKKLGGLSQGRFGEGFTGVLTITKTIDVGLQTIDQGFYITDSEVRNLGDGHSLKITQTIDAFPILRERDIDQVEGIITLIEKRVIAPLDANYNPDPGGYTEVHAYDKWRSIQITSKLDLNSIPPVEVYATGIDIHLPPTLLEIYVNYSDSGGDSESADEIEGHDNTASCSVTAGGNGDIGIRARDGYRGSVLGTVTRRFLTHPPTLAELTAFGYVPTKILTATGSATLVTRHVKFTQEQGDAHGSNSNEGTLQVHTTDLSGYLTGGYTVTNASSAASAYAAALAGDNEVIMFLPGPHMDLYVNLPLSTPGLINPHDTIIADVKVTKHRFGLWVVEVFKFIVPSNA